MRHLTSAGRAPWGWDDKSSGGFDPIMENEQDYQKRIEELEAQLAAEKAKQTRAVYLKVSEKGGASLYGIRRFPITFYVEEWNRILDMESEIRSFLRSHEDELARKD
jgi:hypothetical protein